MGTMPVGTTWILTSESDKFYFSVYQVSQNSRKRNDDNKSRGRHDQDRHQIS